MRPGNETRVSYDALTSRSSLISQCTSSWLPNKCLSKTHARFSALRWSCEGENGNTDPSSRNGNENGLMPGME